MKPLPWIFSVDISADTIRVEATSMITNCRSMGVEITMLTGDHQEAALHVMILRLIWLRILPFSLGCKSCRYRIAKCQVQASTCR